MSIAIVTDSTCDLPTEVVAEQNITVVPVHVLWGTESYLDVVELTPEELYRRLADEKTLPQTSQPSPAEFASAYRQARDSAKADSVICITLAKELSGTYNSALQAREQVNFPVHVSDGRTASMPLGFLVLTAVDARNAGLPLEGVIEAVNAKILDGQVYFTLATLEYLRRGGRIGAAKRLIGDTLKIRPILYVEEGTIAVRESARTRRRVVNRMVDLVAEAQQNRKLKRIGVIHGAAHEEAEALRGTLTERFGVEQVYLNHCSAAVGVHLGPGVIGVAYQLD